MRKIVLGFILICGTAFAEGYWAEPVKLPEVVNDTVFDDSLWDRFHAHISPDGTELYYTLHNSPYGDDIYVARFDPETEVWDSVTRLSVNMDDVRRELSPSITADHSRLFWCSWGRDGSYGGYDVWFAEWDSVAGDWGEAQNAGPNVNTPGYEFTCFIAPDGKTLYASSHYDADGEDIFKHTWQEKDSTWGPRERVFEELNPGGDQYSPWVTADGRWIYLIQIHTNYGRTIYRSRWQGEYFGEPEWLGEPVCLPGWYTFDTSPSLNPEGSRLYFASNRPDSNYQSQYIWYSEYKDATEEYPYADLFMLSISPLSRDNITINYILPETSQVFCGVFDTAGNLVRILASERQQGGDHKIIWNALDSRNRKVSSGTYFVQLTVGRQKVVRKTIYLK